MPIIHIKKEQTAILLRDRELRIDAVFNKDNYKAGPQTILGVDSSDNQVELSVYVETFYLKSDDTLEVYIYLEE